MKLVGKFLHRLQDFPEYKDLEQEIQDLQKYDGKILTGLQQSFGPSMSEFARLHEARLRETLIALHEIGRCEVSELRNLLSSTSSFPSDMRQINEFHNSISRKRNELKGLQEECAKCDKEVKHAISQLDKARSQGGGTSETARCKALYDELCIKKQTSYDALERKREENERYEVEYRKTVMQIVIAAFEMFATANMKAMEAMAQCGKNMKEAAVGLEQASEDPSIAELEARLVLLDEEMECA